LDWIHFLEHHPRVSTPSLAIMSSLEAKIVVLGSQGVGKTSLVMRYCKGSFNPSQVTSTVGASFMTKRVVDSDTDTVVRLQIWDTGKSITRDPSSSLARAPSNL
jgi:GTPase SAR1 family protein